MILNGNTTGTSILNGSVSAGAPVLTPATATPLPDPRATGWYYCYVNMNQAMKNYLYNISSRDNLIVDLTIFPQAAFQVAGISTWADMQAWMALNCPQISYGVYAGTAFCATRANQDAGRADTTRNYNMLPRTDGYAPYVPKDDFPAAAIIGPDSTYPVEFPNAYAVDPTNNAAQDLMAAYHVRRCQQAGVQHCLTDEMGNQDRYGLMIRMSRAFRSAGLRYMPNIAAVRNWFTADSYASAIGRYADAAVFESYPPSLPGTEAQQIPADTQQDLIDYMRRMELIVAGGCTPIYLAIGATVNESVTVQIPFHNALALMLRRCLVARSINLDVPTSSDWPDRLGARVGTIDVSASRVISCEFEKGMLLVDGVTRAVTLRV